MSAPDLVVSMDDPTPPYEQLRRQFEQLITSGLLQPGTRLPPLRQLAGDLRLAVGTVARTYRELEAVGLVQSRRGGGTRVAELAAQPSPDPEFALRQDLTAAVRRARTLGASAEQIRGIVDELLAEQSDPKSVMAKPVLP